MSTWNILVVDDEEDVHTVTTLALKRRVWKGRRIVLTHARSGEEARALLVAPDAKRFHLALVDVAMETPDAGLKLCDFIRGQFPPTLRIILRTGQAGAAPEERVLNTHDIDQYLAKSEVTEHRLYGAVRTSLRVSHELSGVLAIARQLRSFAAALEDPATTAASLDAMMQRSLASLEERYLAKISFVADAESPATGAEANADAIRQADQRGTPLLELVDGASFGLAAGLFVALLSRRGGGPPASRASSAGWFEDGAKPGLESATVSGVVVSFTTDADVGRSDFLRDLELFITNWRLAQGALRHRESLRRPD